jgi:tRNA nucleotidyltransferase (CCA-adding enzyme)
VADVKLDPPKEVALIAATLRDAGYEAWCVGGAVRDALLGHAHLDWDIATSARPEKVQELFKRTVPVGIDFGTVGVLDKKNVMHEITTFRKDVKTDGRHAVVEFGVSLDDDLARRDFTMNAMAYDPATGELRDPYDGRGDIKRGVVRAVGKASDRMKEDRLRALRAIRFAARFGFKIEPSTWSAIRDSAPELKRLSAERVKQELEKTMQQVEKPSAALEWWRESGALNVLVPTLAKVSGTRFRAIDLIPREGEGATLNRLALLWFGEDPKVVEKALRSLKFSNADSAWIVALARARHGIGAPIDATLTAGDVDPEEIRRWIAFIGRTRTDAFCMLTGAQQLARTAAADPATGKWIVDKAREARIDAFRKSAVAIAFRDPVEISDLAIDGEDLAKIGVLPGPAVGAMLKSLLDLVLGDPKQNTRAILLAAAKAMAPRENVETFRRQPGA